VLFNVSAVVQSNVFIAVGLQSAGFKPQIRAATPATCGVDIEVPAINVRQSTGAVVPLEFG
jgi:hypothetical protein